MMTLRRLVGRALPRPLKRRLLAAWLRAAFRRATRQLMELPPGTPPSEPLIRRLLSSWDNEGFAGTTTLVDAVARRVCAGRAGILECGSGLTTILIGAMTRRSGREVWVLEHLPEWGARVQRELDRLGLDHVRLQVSPLRNFGEYSWYDADLGRLSGSFDFVLCDGPPSEDTPGGRSGLIPRMHDRLDANAVIIFDDAARPSEQAVLRRWQDEFGIRSHLEGTDALVAIITLSGGRAQG